MSGVHEVTPKLYMRVGCCSEGLLRGWLSICKKNAVAGYENIVQILGLGHYNYLSHAQLLKLILKCLLVPCHAFLDILFLLET